VLNGPSRPIAMCFSYMGRGMGVRIGLIRRRGTAYSLLSLTMHDAYDDGTMLNAD